MPKSKPPRKKYVREGKPAAPVSPGLKLRLDQGVWEEMRTLGFNEFWIGYYTSDRSVDTELINSAIRTHTKETAFCFYEAVERRDSISVPNQRLFQKATGPMNTIVTEKVWMEGDYLAIVLPSQGLEWQDIFAKRAAICATIRTIFGEWIAKDLHVHAKLDPAKRTQNFTGDAKYVIARAHHLYPISLEHSEVNKVAIGIKPEAMALIEATNEHENSLVFFALRWIALESQIGNGDARRRFCRDELKSQVANDEMERLRDIRHDIFHKGLDYKVTGLDRYSLETLFLLSTLPPSDERVRVVAEF